MLKTVFHIMLWALFITLTAGQVTAADYETAKTLGEKAAQEAADILDLNWSDQEVIVLTNAGYARPNGISTRGCLDGLSQKTGTSQGKNNLIKLQDRFDQPLWFAFYIPETGKTAYLQLNEKLDLKSEIQGKKDQDLFALSHKARVDADYLFEDPDKYEQYIQDGLFGANLFRTIAAANIAEHEQAPFLTQALQFHDHYCPGVTSGILLARFIEKNIFADAPEARSFILSLQPWCKEDALQVLLNTTPGKRGYGVFYPDSDAVQTWPDPLDKTCTVVFTRQKDSPWQGWMLEFDFDLARKKYDGPQPENEALNKLALGLWMMDTIHEPQRFVSVHQTFVMDKDLHPRELLHPEADPVQMLSEM